MNYIKLYISQYQYSIYSVTATLSDRQFTFVVWRFHKKVDFNRQSIANLCSLVKSTKVSGY